ncbi:T9SS type A sorting domain-containing protein [bacterium]|nr:T9SS type A sorting domain-containing protein [bacterium]
MQAPTYLSRPWLLAAVALTIHAFAGSAAARTIPIEPNQGTVAPEVRFLTRGGASSVYFTDHGFVVDLKERRDSTGPVTYRGHAIHVTFEAASGSPAIVPGLSTGARVSEFHGSDPSGWKRDLATYESITYRNPWPGVDVTFSSDENGLSYRIDAVDGPAAGQVKMTVRGASVTEDAGRTRQLETSLSRRVEWSTREDGGRFEWAPPARGDVPRARSTTYWGTFLGGASADEGGRPLIASNGDLIIVGASVGSDFPTTPGAYDETDNDGSFWESVVCRMTSDGSTLLWSTYIGGTSNDQAQRAVLDGSDNVWLYGAVTSSNWPTTAGAYDETHNGGYDCVVAELSSDGTTLLFSTFLGGGGTEFLIDLEFDAGGNPVCTGVTSSTNFPTTPGVYQPTYQGGTQDGFVARLSSDGTSLLASTFLGGTGSDHPVAGAIQFSGDVIVAGHTYSTDYPTTAGAFQETYGGGGTDGVLTRLNSDFTSVVWSTFFGGDSTDQVDDLEISAADDIFLVGGSMSPNFPTTVGAYQTNIAGDQDGVAARFSASTGQPSWSTFVGGSDTESFWDMELLASGFIVFAGQSRSVDFPVTVDALDGTPNGLVDAVVGVLSPSGADLLYGTVLGGTSNDVAYGIAIGADQCLFLSGTTSSTDFPASAGAYDETHNGGQDIFVSSWSLAIPLEEPSIGGIVDVPNDQGLQVRMTFLSSVHDDGADPDPVVSYSIFRRWDNLPGRAYPTGDWDFVTSIPASGESIYHVVLPTLCDCQVGQDCTTSFFVRAVTTNPFAYYDSAPDAGCSVDNIAPPAPQMVTLDGSLLSWEAAPAPDLAWYRVYHSTESDLSGATLLTETEQLSADLGSVDYGYVFVRTLDDGGNESTASAPVAWGTGVVVDGSSSFRLNQNRPNPFRPSTEISFQLDRSEPVSLVVFDVGGRLVRRLVESEGMDAGGHSVRWSGRSDRGDAVAPGIYFYRLTAGNRVEVRKMTLLK